jgi:creatinine amidohydrolase
VNFEIDPEQSLRLDHLSWPEVRRLLTADPRLILPVGALDHHGPHLPLGANTLIAERVALDLSGRLQLVVAPTFHYGLTKPDWAPYPGTGTLRRKTFHRAINELLASWDDHGIDEVVIITAQRHEPHIEALLTALTENATTEIVDLMTIDVADLVEGHPEEERGGELETSLLLFLAPELVRMDEAVDFLPHSQSSGRYVEGRVTTPPPGFQGVVGRPTLATAEKGAAAYHRYIAILEEALAHDSPSDA